MSHELYKSCIQACNDCAAACEHCATSCLHEQDVKMMAKCIEYDRFCADICRMSAAFMARSDDHTSNFVKSLCSLCAEICEACGNECRKHSHFDHCRKCSEACLKCAEECRKMAA